VPRLHYAPGSNFGRHGAYLPKADGFNLADLNTPGDLSLLPAHVKALVYLGLCTGATTEFKKAVRPFVGKQKVYGFYLMDEPIPPKYSGSAPGCRAASLKAESGWIHAHDRGALTFVVLDDQGTDTKPIYRGTYSPSNTHVDLFGLDPYPCQRQWHGCHDGIIKAAVKAARADHIRVKQIVPVYQAFGGGGYRHWTLPTPKQERAILDSWQRLVPAPDFDYAYAWGQQSGDRSLADAPKLRAVFAEHNR